MVMTDDRVVLVDTNVLLSATTPFRSLHHASLAVLNDWPNEGVPLAVSSQVLREYLAVATRPIEANGLGLDVGDALANVAAFHGRMRLLIENELVWDRLQYLIATYGCRGKQIHDANLVATGMAFSNWSRTSLPCDTPLCAAAASSQAACSSVRRTVIV
jgi:predicted nucleic acid-binding protein